MSQPVMTPLSEDPNVDESAKCHASQLGRYTEVGARVILNNVRLGITVISNMTAT